MNCEAVHNLEDLYEEGRLTPARSAQVEAHIKDCPSCAQRIKGSRPLAGLGGIKAPKDLKERMKKLLAKLETTEPAMQTGAFTSESEIWPVAATIALYVGAALLLAWAGPGVPSQKYEKAPVAVPAEVTP